MHQGHGFWNDFGPRTARMFRRGDFKYLILELLKEKPRHGYEIIRDLEDKFHGFYSPSPGSIYPTLQWLEEMGYVTSSQQEGKKIYTITDEGRRYQEEQEKKRSEFKNQMKDRWERWNSDFRNEFRDFTHDLRDIGRTVRQKVDNLDKEKLSKVRSILSKAFHDIEDALK